MPRVRTRFVEWLLALLVLRQGRSVDRSWLAGTLWPDSEENQALHNLRDILVYLRKALGPERERIQSPTRDTLLLDLEGAQVDVVAFDAAIKAGDEASLQSAVVLYTGLLLEGCLEEWVFPERASREQECLRALETLADAAERRTDDARALILLHRAKEMDPLRDSTRRGLMRVLAASGDVPAALHSYREYRLLLREQMNVEPDEETVRLDRQIRQRAASQEREGARGRHKENTEREEGRVEPPTPNAQRPFASSALPHAITPLIGREEQMREIASAISRSRLVTLIGGGGVGKTRLAIEVAGELASTSAQEVAFVALASLSDPTLLLTSVVTILGIRGAGALEPTSLLQSLTSWLSTHPVLFVLDNCEHLIEAAAALAQALLERCPDLRILATSRQRLGLTGEVVWRVPSLPVAEVEQLPADLKDAVSAAQTFPAIRLFVERAVSAHPEFQLARREEVEAVCRICRRLDGIPLAIELAAARVRSLTVEDIHSRLDQRFRLLTGGSRAAVPRQQTLKSLIDWSYELLNDAEKALLCRLSVFSGGWTLKAAEAVASDKEESNQIPPSSFLLPPFDVLDLLTALADKSLVVAETSGVSGRYRLLETVRQYAGEKLALAADSDVYRRQHRDYFLAMAEEIRPKLLGAEQAHWFAVLETDHDNLRHAMTGATDDSVAGEQVLRLASALQRFWMIRGHLREGLVWMRSALSHPVAQRRTKLRADGLSGAAGLAIQQGDTSSARIWLEECLMIRRELGDLCNISGTLRNLGNVVSQQRDFVAARALHEECLALSRELNDRLGTAYTLVCLGNVATHMGELALAQSLFVESLALLRELKDQQGIALALINLGIVDRTRSNFTSATSHLEEALRLVRELDNKDNTAPCMNLLGEIAAERGELDSARAMFEETMEIRLELGQSHTMVELLESYALLARKENLPDLTATLRSAAEHLRVESGQPMCALVRDGYSIDMHWARGVLSDADFELATTAGRGMTLDQAIRFALSEASA